MGRADKAAVMTPQVLFGQMISQSDAAVVACLRVAALRTFDERCKTSPVLKKNDPLVPGQSIADLLLEKGRKGGLLKLPEFLLAFRRERGFQRRVFLLPLGTHVNDSDLGHRHFFNPTGHPQQFVLPVKNVVPGFG